MFCFFHGIKKGKEFIKVYDKFQEIMQGLVYVQLNRKHIHVLISCIDIVIKIGL